MKIRSLLVAAAAVAAIVPAVASAQNIVANPSFENQTPRSDGILVPPGWTLNAGPNGYFQGNGNTSYVHTGLFDISSACGGTSSTSTLNQGCYVTQVLNTVAGQSYNLSLWLYNYAGSTPAASGYSVFFGGQQVASQLFAPVDFGWTQFTTGNLLATGTQTDLQIHLRSDLGQIFLDDVSVTANATPPTPSVPEPAGWAMMIAGFGMVGAGLRARRRTVLRHA